MLTDCQARVLNFIRDYAECEDVAPSRREIAGALDIAVGTVSKTVDALVRKGRLERLPYRPRAIQIARPKPALQILHPLYCPDCDGDVVPAGSPPVCPKHGRPLAIAAE